jgi:hypothetical protein
MNKVGKRWYKIALRDKYLTIMPKGGSNVGKWTAYDRGEGV